MTCACGCGHEARGKSRYATDACRARAWRERVGYGPQKPLQSRSNGKQRPSGRQISYRKAVATMTEVLLTRGTDPLIAPQIAEMLMEDCLPERQRRCA